MINTIFYFPNKDEITFEDYRTRSNKDYSGDDKINGRTIVFDPTQGEIWKNGQKYSHGKVDIDAWIQEYLTNHNIKPVNLDDYAKQQWVINYLSDNGYLKSTNIDDVFKGVSYNNDQLIFTKWDGTTTDGITIGSAQLGEPLNSIKNLGNPSNGDGLVYRNGQWKYEAYGTGGSGTGSTYTPGTGINISNNEISLKPASANEIGGIKVGGSSELSGKNYPVQITSGGVAYVNVPWTSGQVSASYSVDVTPPVITVPTDTAGTGNVSNVKCNISVYYNGEPRTIDIDGIVIGTVTRGSGKSTSGIAATPVGNTAVNVSFNNVSEFAGDSADIPINIKIGGNVIAAISISAIGMTAAPQSGANAITMWTSTETVHVGWEYNNCDPEVINFGVRSGDVVNTSFSNSGYTVWYSYGNQNSWTKLTSNPLTIDKTKLNQKYILVELRKGSSDTRVENTLVDSKYIHLIVDQQPVIGVTDYKINVIQSTMKYKSGESDFSGLLKFQVLFNSNGEWSPVTNQSITVLSGGNKWIENSVIYDDTLSNDNWVINTSEKTYTLDFLDANMSYYDAAYSMIYVYDGTTMIASQFVPFIVEGADGEITGDGPQQGISGTVMRFYSYNTEEQIRTKGVTGGSDAKWYTGDGDEENGVKYLDVLYFDGAYYRKRGASGTISHAPTYTTQQQVMTTNYVYSGSSSTGGEEWVCFNMNVDAAFNALIAKYGFIENLTGHELVITDENEPVAGMTSGSVTSDSSKINGVNRGSVRIWAGTPTDNNLYNCPFYVTNTGELHATNVVISGTMLDMASPVYTYSNSNGLSVVNGTKWAFVITPETVNGRTHDKVWRVVNWDKQETSTATLVDEEGNTTTKSGDQLTGRQYLEMPAGSGYIILTSTAMGNTQDNPIKILPPAKFCKGKEITISYCSYPRYDLYSEEELIANSYKVDGTYAGSYAGGDICWTFQYNGDYDSLNDYVLLYPGDVVKLVSDGTKWIAIAKFSTYINYTSHS